MATCPDGHENPDDQRFCGECGARIQTAGTSAASTAPSADPERVERPDYRRFVIAAIAASVGVMIGSVGQWVTAGMFSLNGLTDWEGKTALALGAASCVAMVIEFFWPRDWRWAIPIAWAVAVAGVASLSFALPMVIRIMTIPKESFLGIPVGAEVGWGLWLLALSSAVMCVAASIVATQIAQYAESSLGHSETTWTHRWRWAAVIATAAIVASSIVYFSTHWENHPSGIGSSPTEMPSFPNFPSFPTTAMQSTTTEASTTSAPQFRPPGTDSQGWVGTLARCNPGDPPAVLMYQSTLDIAVICQAGPGNRYHALGTYYLLGASNRSRTDSVFGHYDLVRVPDGFDWIDPWGTRFQLRLTRLRRFHRTAKWIPILWSSTRRFPDEFTPTDSAGLTHRFGRDCRFSWRASSNRRRTAPRGLVVHVRRLAGTVPSCATWYGTTITTAVMTSADSR